MKLKFKRLMWKLFLRPGFYHVEWLCGPRCSPGDHQKLAFWTGRKWIIWNDEHHPKEFRQAHLITAVKPFNK